MHISTYAGLQDMMVNINDVYSNYISAAMLFIAKGNDGLDNTVYRIQNDQMLFMFCGDN